MENIGLTIPGNWSFEIRRISPRFHPWNPVDFTHEIWQISPVKSSGFHPWNLADFTWNLPDFMKSTGFHEIKNVSFCVMIKYRSFFRKTKTKSTDPRETQNWNMKSAIGLCTIFFKIFCWTKVHFVGSLISLILDFVWPSPRVSEPGWFSCLHTYLLVRGEPKGHVWCYICLFHQ